MEKQRQTPVGLSPRKWLLLLFVALCTLAAPAQDVKVSIDADRQPLAKVLNMLEQQSGYNFFYSNDLIADATPVTIKVSNEALADVLKRILPQRNLSYTVDKRQIILARADAPASQGPAKKKGGATVTVRGRVTDKTGEPLIGVSVKSGAQGVTTDIDGNYTIQVPQGSSLEFSYVGCAPTSKKAVEGKPLDVVMLEDSEILNEVVVIGYGTMDKKELTSAISHVGEKDFLTISAADPAALIKGKVSGVSVDNTGAADPNSASGIQIRGATSRQAGTSPLIVIDGVAGGSLQNVNPADIASFDVLKDGAASAIYGTRGANGVILVTTKKGTKDGAVHTTFGATLSWDKMKRELEMMDAQTFREYRSAWGDDITGGLGGNYDWLDGVSRTGFSQKYTLSLSGGNERTKYRVSVDYRDANGIDLRSEREEYGGRASINHTTKGGLLTFAVNLAPRIVYSDQSDWLVFKEALEANPTTPLMDPTDPSKYYNFIGQIAGSNPVERQKLHKDRRDSKYLDWDATVKLNLLPLLSTSENCPINLNTQLMFADRQYTHNARNFIPSTSTEAINNGYKGFASQSYDSDRQYTLEWLGNFSAKFGRNNVKAMVGYSYTYSQGRGFNGYNRDFANDGLGADNLGSGEYAGTEGATTIGSWFSDSKLISFFGRVSYDWDGRYFVTASLRHEGSSKFGNTHKWGNFPAVSAGWRISQETFMEGTRSWLSELKIRGDYGVTGNQDFASYQSIPTMKGFGYYLINGKYMQVWGTETNVNPDLHWEKSKNWNIGLDFSMFKDRFRGSFNYFNRHSEDLLGSYAVPIPPYLHANTVVNVGSMSNTGFEFDLQVTAVNLKDFSYDISLTGSTMKNRFESFSNSEFVGQDYYDECGTENPFPRNYLQRIQAGESIGNFFMYRYAGINDKGEWLVYDKDGDIIDLWMADENDKQIVGNGLPKFTMSMTHTFRYRNFDLSLFFRGAFGFDLFNIHEFYYGTRKFSGNMMLKAYGKNFEISPTSPHAVTDFFLERGDYFKLDQLTLGYTLRTPKARFLDGVRVYGAVNNVFTLTKFTGVDPSTYGVNGLTPGGRGSRVYYPSTRQFILGVQLDF